MPYYHATHRARLPSILKHGLGGGVARKNWEDAESGVYLSECPHMAVYFMVEHFATHAPEYASPREALAAIAVIVIDDSRVPRGMLGPDPSIPYDGVWLFRGVLDVRNMPVVGVDEIVPAGKAE